MVLPLFSSTHVLGGTENLLRFPHSPAFRHPPANLVPFDAFRAKGLFVPLPLTVDAGGGGRVEVDGAGIPTVDLENDHAHVGANTSRRGQGRGQGRKGEVVKVVVPQDAWRLGRDETWVEPEGTYRGGHSSEDAPWDRVMRALTQFVSSRSSSYGKAYISHDVEFRLVAGLQHAQSYDPHIRGGNVPVRRTADGEWISPTEDEEASPFIRDMVGTLKAYWTKVMGDAHGRIHRITAKESFEIINSFLHYLSHYRILASDPYLATSLTTTLALSSLMLAQISIAQRLCDALPGAVTPDAWHALTLDAWLRGPMRADDDAWERNGAAMTRRVEAGFTQARQESMQRNILEGLVDAVEGMAVREQDGRAVEDDTEGGEPGKEAIDWRADTPDRSAEQAIRTLSSVLGTDAAGYKTRQLDIKEYTIASLSATEPASLPAGRLDVCFARAHAARADDFLWLTLAAAVTEEPVIVVLVDGKGLDGVAEGNLGLAVGKMRVEAGLMLVGEDEAETPVVRVLERVAPMFPERSGPPEV
ncbi:hypothetical protein NliqN6_1869 [Naganishia liquefaciens]|uniref:Uncharacterized protein n=1 Tax=Naganishia liquefaciens TaxID=104408 RepID=A0A8H3YEQ0_9TREE|nr:hypothetical protein NliqN6_1869 [Naganishia liquefaciens]